MAQSVSVKQGTQLPPLAVVLAVNVREERVARGWSMEQLGVYAGLSRDTVSAMEAACQGSRAQGVQTRSIEGVAIALGRDWTDLLKIHRARLRLYDEASRVYLPGGSSRLSLVRDTGDALPQRT